MSIHVLCRGWGLGASYPIILWYDWWPKLNLRIHLNTSSPNLWQLWDKNARFIFCHVIRTVEAESYRKGSVTSFRRYKYNTDAIVECVRRPIKNQGPSGFLFRSVIWSKFFTVVYHHDVFIREFEHHGLVVFQAWWARWSASTLPFIFSG